MKNSNELYSNLSAIGIRVDFDYKDRSKVVPDIEQTLIRACYEIDNDGRMLGLLFSWLKVHGHHLTADKFFKEYSIAKKYLGESPWFHAICAYRYHLKDHRFKKGVLKLKIAHHFGNRDQTSLIKLKGAVNYLEAINVFVPSSALRIRESDVLTPEELIERNLQYRNRYIWGANWRAEIITLIFSGVKTSGEIAKRLGLAKSRVSIVYKECMAVRKFLNA